MTATKPAVEIRKIVQRTAYARNGNAHRPTQYCAWIVTLDGRPYGAFNRKCDAVEALPALVAEWRGRHNGI